MLKKTASSAPVSNYEEEIAGRVYEEVVARYKAGTSFSEIVVVSPPSKIKPDAIIEYHGGTKSTTSSTEPAFGTAIFLRLGNGRTKPEGKKHYFKFESGEDLERMIDSGQEPAFSYISGRFHQIASNHKKAVSKEGQNEEPESPAKKLSPPFNYKAILALLHERKGRALKINIPSPYNPRLTDRGAASLMQRLRAEGKIL